MTKIKYLFDNWNTLKSDFARKYLFLFLDYDGTLTPIAETPQKAKLSPETKNLLNKLSKNSGCKVAIISGRALADIKNAVRLKDIIYVGNHGLEIEGPKIKFVSQIMPRLKSVIRHINDDLVANLSGIKGVLIEDKGLTISVHYRLVDKKDIPVLRSILAEITQAYLVRHKIKINSGKKVYEITPPGDWDKGKMVMWLLARQRVAPGVRKVFPIYVGDDVTDEDAFKALNNKGLTVFVGEPNISKAQYYLKNTEEVVELMRRIIESKKK